VSASVVRHQNGVFPTPSPGVWGIDSFSSFRPGKTPNFALTVFVFVACVCLVAAACSGHGTASGGIAQGRVAQSWSFPVSAKDLIQGFSFNADQRLLVETTSPEIQGQGDARVGAIRTGDGSQAWETSLAPVVPTGAFSGGDYVAVSTTPTPIVDGVNQAPLYILDARTGALLHTVLIHSESDVLGFADGNLVINEADLTYALSPATGRTVWSWTAPCQVNNTYASPNELADSQLIGVACTAAGKSYLYALAPASGHPIWDSPVSPPGEAGGPLMISGSVISYVGQGTVTLFSPTGKKLDTESTRSSAWVGQNGQQAQFAYQAPDQSIQIKVIDISTGKVSRHIALRGYVKSSGSSFLDSVSFSGNTAVILFVLDTAVLPAAVLQVNLADGSRSLSPLPYLTRSGPYIPAGLEQSGLYLVATYTRLDAYRLTPPTGQPPGRAAIMQDTVRRWPNPCSLVPPSTLASLIGAGYRTVRTPILGYGGFPQTSKCIFAAKLPRQISVYVNVMWDADSSAHAAAIFTRELGGGSTVPGPWDSSRYDDNGDLLLPDNTIIRVGHLIIQVYDTDSTHVSQRLAAAITQRIRRTGAGDGS
jgi:outer membrane protein assembly factor BamB